MRRETMERCLACEADAVGDRGTLPRCRSRTHTAGQPVPYCDQTMLPALFMGPISPPAHKSHKSHKSHSLPAPSAGGYPKTWLCLCVVLHLRRRRGRSRRLRCHARSSSARDIGRWTRQTGCWARDGTCFWRHRRGRSWFCIFQLVFEEAGPSLRALPSDQNRKKKGNPEEYSTEVDRGLGQDCCGLRPEDILGHPRAESCS